VKVLINISLILIISVIIISCKDSTVDSNNPPVSPESNFTYPYKLNSFWYYSTRNFVTNLRGDSVHFYFPGDTTVGFGNAKFVKDTIVNQDTLRLLRNEHSEVGHSHTTLELYKQTDSGLIRVAYYYGGTNFGPYRPVKQNLRYVINGNTYASLDELKNAFNVEDYSGDTTLYFDEPPLRVLKYPIEENTEWEFVTFGTTRITKEYTNFENVNTGMGELKCIKVKRNWYYNSSAPDPKFISYDYFSKEGMVKRDFVIKDVVILNQNTDTLGIIDVKEEANLNIFTP